MSRLVSSLANASLVTSRDIDSKYDLIKLVAENMDHVIAYSNYADSAIKYLGGSTTDPVERLDGSPLQDGDYYRDSTTQSFKYYNSSDDSWYAVNQGGQGSKGDKGDSAYIYVAYANSLNGSEDFDTEDSTGKAYLGVYTSDSDTQSTDYSDYTWILIKGDPFLYSDFTVDQLEGLKGDKGDKGEDGSSANISGIADVPGLESALDDKVDSSRVLTDVPANAVFTDTIYSLPFTDNSINWNSAYSWGNHALAGYSTTDTVYDDTPIVNSLSGKQDELISGTNIKTINGLGLLGSGNIIISSEGSLSDSDIKTAYENNSDTNAFTDSEKSKLLGVDSNANNYTHPATHEPSVIEQNATNRFVTDAEKATWNGKSDTDTVYDDTAIQSAIQGKQEELVSGTSIKTINNESLLGAGNIDFSSDNLSNDSSVSGAYISDALENLDNNKLPISVQSQIDANTAKVSNVNHPLVEKAVPSNAKFTDTTYSVGDGGLTENNFTDAHLAKVNEIDNKQDALVSGTSVKTVNNESLLGSGNITITGGSTLTDAEIKTAYENNSNTNAFTNGDKTDLAGAVAHASTTTGNPHNVTKADLNLENVDNTSDAEKEAVTNMAIAAAISNHEHVDKVQGHTVSGVMIAGGIENQLRDGGTFTMPLANSVEADTICVVTLPDTFNSFTPVINISGSDKFVNGEGEDISVNILGSVKVVFTSNGTNKWYLDVITGGKGDKGDNGANGINIPTEIVTEFPASPVSGTLYIKTL